ncbi:HNH endonuclease family protein [Pontibacter flavimaris]|uniref:Restriction endonuclease n=1 Tax=Pontibacter flavimaris TaxID=1797110 RepID=A0A1Q5P9G9_9BACT|nr:restriction endonuclease [Pontibacter flavimaris]OKL38844.1 restriction endonuclease [Pontibacter flavimaris]
MARKQAEQVCELCGREVLNLSRHHLVPREEGGRYGATAELCQPCHSTLHLTFSNRELAQLYNSIPALQQAAPLQKYLKWVRGKRIEKIANRRGKRR